MVREFDNTFGVETFLEVSPEDITEAGKLKPIGARHFAENAQIAQNLQQLYASGIMQDPGVQNHLSGQAIAQLLENVLSLEEFDIARNNVRIAEQLETQQLVQSGRNQLADGQAADEVFIRGGGNGEQPAPAPAAPTGGQT